jgi:hypothetical protein
MKRLLTLVLLLALAGVGVSCRHVPSIGNVRASVQAIGVVRPPVPKFDSDRPLTILVRGWLWDARTRERWKGPVRMFQPRVNTLLEERIGVTSEFFDYQWSRLPKDVLSESERFNRWAAGLTKAAAAEGRCVNFVGHSAGAALIYKAAAAGVPMGYMGTLGLPTFGRGKPLNVIQWTNFFTTGHVDDFAGRVWGPQMAADVNIDLRDVEHRDFWYVQPVASASAEGITRAWTDCRV